MKDNIPSVSIVIVGYNAGKRLKECLDSVYAQSYKDFEVIFIDNGSADETVSILKLYPQIKVVHNPKNKGFSGANNQGIKLARGEYIATLNSDIVLDKDFLKEMLCSNLDVCEAAMFSPKILNINGDLIDSTGLILSGAYKFFDRGSGERDIGQYDTLLDIFGPCAAAALYKKEMLEDIRWNDEYFDKDFFFLGEDFDLAWRALKRGWKARFVPSAICYHLRNSTNFSDKFRQYLSFRNRLFLLIKNADFNIKLFFIFISYDLPRFIYMLFTNRYTFRALPELIRYTPKMIQKRHCAYVRKT